MKNTHFSEWISRTLYKATLLTLALLTLSVGLNVWQAFMPKGKTGTCSSFSSYADILDSFNAGNTSLDGDGDGIPCENRKPNE